MKIPKKLKIGGHVYTVSIVAPVDLEIKDCGLTNREKGSIGINKTLIRSEQEVTLFHEIIHCINSELDESTVDFLAQSLYAVFKNNNMLK